MRVGTLVASFEAGNRVNIFFILFKSAIRVQSILYADVLAGTL